MRLSDQEIVTQFEIDIRTLNRWLADGCPNEPAVKAVRGKSRRKPRTFDLQEVRAWLKGRQAYKAKVGSDDEQISVPPEIADRIREANRPAELEGIAREIAALVALGQLPANRATAIKALLSESRALYKLVGAESEIDKAILAGKEAYELVGVFEQIFDGRERKKVISAARKALKADRKRWPDSLREKPTEFVEKLEKEGLDAWGDKK